MLILSCCPTIAQGGYEFTGYRSYRVSFVYIIVFSFSFPCLLGIVTLIYLLHFFRLSLSGIANLVNPKINKIIFNHLSNEEESRLQPIITSCPLPQLQTDTCDFLLSIKSAAELGDVDTVLRLIIERKLDCIKNKSTTASELYQCLSSMEHM